MSKHRDCGCKRCLRFRKKHAKFSHVAGDCSFSHKNIFTERRRRRCRC